MQYYFFQVEVVPSDTSLNMASCPLKIELTQGLEVGDINDTCKIQSQWRRLPLG